MADLLFLTPIWTRSVCLVVVFTERLWDSIYFTVFVDGLFAHTIHSGGPPRLLIRSFVSFSYML